MDAQAAGISVEQAPGAPPKPPSPRPRAPRGSRCTRPKHVRLALVKVAKDLRTGTLDYQTANALVNCYRVILASLDGSEVEKRLAELEAIVARATQAARERLT
jgi:hypothetical protein